MSRGCQGSSFPEFQIYSHADLDPRSPPPIFDYDQLLASVERVFQSQLTQARKVEAHKSDAEIIDAITDCIKESINARMRLRDEVNKRTGISKRKVLAILDKYTGKIPDQHRWFYTVKEHGKHVFQLLT